MTDARYPFEGNPRRFAAAAMPQGDHDFGVKGPLVFVCERRGGCVVRPKYLSIDEATKLRDELADALRVFEVGAGLGAPVAASGYPFRDHRTMAEVG